MKVYYSPLYCKAKHVWDTTRKAADVAKLIEENPIDGVGIYEPEPLTIRDLMWAHDWEYIRAVETGYPKHLAESNGFEWDPWLPIAVRSSNGGIVDAAHSALDDGVSGSLSSGLHHAKRDRGGGFCTFNGLAIAAIDVLHDRNVNNILIVDYDAHYGDGTMDIIKQFSTHITMIDISTSGGFDDTNYVEQCRSLLAETLHAQKFDLVLYNAGADPHEKCLIGGRKGVSTACLKKRDRHVFELCGQRDIPVAFCLAGGYANIGFTPHELALCHYNTVVQANRYAKSYD